MTDLCPACGAHDCPGVDGYGCPASRPATGHKRCPGGVQVGIGAAPARGE